jgi:hypothetical protein
MKQWRRAILNYETTHPSRLISARRSFNAHRRQRLQGGEENTCRVKYSPLQQTITFTEKCTLPAKIFNPSPSPLLVDDVLTDDKENRPTDDDINKIMKKRRAWKAWGRLVSAKVSKVTDQKIAKILEKGVRKRLRVARQAKYEPPHDPLRDDILGIRESVQGEKKKPNYEEPRDKFLQRKMANRRLAMGLPLAGGQQSAATISFSIM